MTVCRKIARQIVTLEHSQLEVITPAKVHEFLGVIKYRQTQASQKSEIGLATGLAWTEVGGEVLLTEVTTMDGKGDLTLTGKLGEVMQESAKAAITYVRSHANEYGLGKDFYKLVDLHVHIPEGAIPKDGPSAGITLATTIVSALTRIPVRKDVAMTGEITLRGKVLPIGGVKEKLLAAHRAGIKNIILPKENERDLKDIPESVLQELNITLVETMDEVLKVALERKEEAPAESKGGSFSPIEGDTAQDLPRMH